MQGLRLVQAPPPSSCAIWNLVMARGRCRILHQQVLGGWGEASGTQGPHVKGLGCT